MSELDRPTWVEINLSNIAHNVQTLKKHIGKASLMAVVKANGYGHGAIQVARVALANGVSALAVATPQEGHELRKNGIVVPILVLGALLPEQAPDIVDAGLAASVGSRQEVEALAAAATVRKRHIGVHVNVDTGMGRAGVAPDKVVDLLKQIEGMSNIRIDGLYTHFATAEQEDTAFAQQQLNRFLQVVQLVRQAGLRVPTLHAANSAAVIGLPEAHLDMVRAGLAIYGLYPAPGLRSRIDLRPALSFKTRIIQLRRLPAGSSISYGRTYVTSRDTLIATLPVGYADGFPRQLSNRVDVLIGGRRFPVVGQICMDLCMVDLGEASASIGDEAVLIGQQGEETIPVDEWADKLGTISYEIVTSIANRVARRYVK